MYGSRNEVKKVKIKHQNEQNNRMVCFECHESVHTVRFVYFLCISFGLLRSRNFVNAKIKNFHFHYNKRSLTLLNSAVRCWIHNFSRIIGCHLCIRHDLLFFQKLLTFYVISLWWLRWYSFQSFCEFLWLVRFIR